jgi:hypothetical protein
MKQTTASAREYTSKLGQECPTFLPLVKLWRTWVIDTWLLRVCENLSTAFMNALLRHTEQFCMSRERE